jgi:hypothetical protein
MSASVYRGFRGCNLRCPGQITRHSESASRLGLPSSQFPDCRPSAQRQPHSVTGLFGAIGSCLTSGPTGRAALSSRLSPQQKQAGKIQRSPFDTRALFMASKSKPLRCKRISKHGMRIRCKCPRDSQPAHRSHTRMWVAYSFSGICTSWRVRQVTSRLSIDARMRSTTARMENSLLRFSCRIQRGGRSLRLSSAAFKVCCAATLRSGGGTHPGYLASPSGMRTGRDG